MKKKQSISPKPNWLGWIKWRPLYRNYSITCCDCGLAHRFQIRVIKGKVQWRAKRDKEATKLARSKKMGRITTIEYGTNLQRKAKKMHLDNKQY